MDDGGTQATGPFRMHPHKGEDEGAEGEVVPMVLELADNADVRRFVGEFRRTFLEGGDNGDDSDGGDGDGGGGSGGGRRSKRFSGLHMLCLNAGLTVPAGGVVQPWVTRDGFEGVYATNYVGNFLLLNLLLPSLQAAAAAGSPSRVAVVSSLTHWWHTADVEELMPTSERALTSMEGQCGTTYNHPHPPPSTLNASAH